MDTLSKIIGFVNDNILWGIPMVVLILGVGIYLTVRNRFMQVTKFPYAVKNTIGALGKKQALKGKGKSLSQFEAFSTAIAGTVGTGNIVGVATALVAGGPGAIFWMWASAFVGMFTNYAENVLGIYYRKKNKDGHYVGGPMYYIEEGLGLKWLAVLFAVFCMFASFGMNMVQVNTIASTLDGGFSMPDWLTGLIVAVLIALIIIGGVKRIGKIASMIVPFMCLSFIVMALVIIFINVKQIPAALGMIFSNAFSIKAVGGGVLGYAFMRAMRYGLARGIFSNEAGLGSSVIAHSASDTREPVKQGLWGIFGVFLDTIIICTLTALVLITSGVYESGMSSDGGANLTQTAFVQSFGTFGNVVFCIILPLFAFTTILSWAYYGEKSFEYIFGGKYVLVYKIIYVALIVVGAVSGVTLVWDLADLFNGLMAIPNLIALFVLGGAVTRITRNYFERKNNKDIMPMLSAYPEENAAHTEEYLADGGEEYGEAAGASDNRDEAKSDSGSDDANDAEQGEKTCAVCEGEGKVVGERREEKEDVD